MSKYREEYMEALTEKGETIPEKMLAYWEIEHEKYIDCVNEIRLRQEIYKK